MSIEKDVLTTGEVAKICNVAPRTVSKWFDSGQLGGYRIPGSKDRRIPVPELYRFMKAHGIPMEGISYAETRILVVDSQKEICDALEKALIDSTDYEVRVATTAFQAGLECERFRPLVILMDIHISDTEGQSLAQMIRTSDHMQMTRVIAMSGKLTDGQAQSLRVAGYDSFLKKPFAVRDAIKAIEDVTTVVH